MKTKENYLTCALPPAPGLAGVPGQPDLSGVISPGTRRCRECGTDITGPGWYLCNGCREIVEARRLARKRVLQQSRDAVQKPVQRKKKKKPADDARACRTAGCGRPVEGRKIFCDACRRGRKSLAQRTYRLRKDDIDPLPTGPPTSMDWLKGFNGWIRSGLSYAEYQAADRERRLSRKKRASPARGS
jgi:hypothetical protein